MVPPGDVERSRDSTGLGGIGRALVGYLKLVPVVLLRALVHELDLPVPTWSLPVLIASTGVLSFLYGAVAIVQKLLVLKGALTVTGFDSAAFWGHLLIWDPIWIIGGLLLVVSGWVYHRPGVTRRLFLLRRNEPGVPPDRNLVDRDRPPP